MMEATGRAPKDGGKAAHISPSQENLRNFGKFEFGNGDRYEGQYLAIKPLLSIVRDGQGTYWSNKSVYTGLWNKDILEKVDQITFPDNSVFIGTLENMVLEGPGKYKYKEGIEIWGNFQNNHFVGDVDLKDPNGHNWKALNTDAEDEILFFPVQPFWQSVLNINNFISPYDHSPSEN